MDPGNSLVARGSAYRRLFDALHETCAVLGLSPLDTARLAGAVRLALVILESGRSPEGVSDGHQLHLFV
jgi:hypothetical protein